MPPDQLNEREFELVNIVGAKLGSNQRDLSRQMDMSLGMVNMLIRRLISKGYIRIRQLNKRKVEYILTPKGFTEKMRKSVKYTLKTISSIGLIQKNLNESIQKLYSNGERLFYILGESDLVTLVDWTFRGLGLNDVKLVHIKDVTQIPKEVSGVVLICTENVSAQSLNGHRSVDLIAELSIKNNFSMRIF